MVKRLSYVKRNYKKRSVKRNYKKRSVKRNVKKNYRKRSVKRKYRGGAANTENLQLFFKYYSATNKKCNTLTWTWTDDNDDVTTLVAELNDAILSATIDRVPFIHKVDDWSGKRDITLGSYIDISYPTPADATNERWKVLGDDVTMVFNECNNLSRFNRMGHVSFLPNWNTYFDKQAAFNSCESEAGGGVAGGGVAGGGVSSKFNSKILQNSYTKLFQEQIHTCLNKLLSSKHNKGTDDYLTIYEGYHINSTNNLYPRIFEQKYSIIPDQYGICSASHLEIEKNKVYIKIGQYVNYYKSEMKNVETSVDILSQGGYAHLELKYKCRICNEWKPKRNMETISVNNFMCVDCNERQTRQASVAKNTANAARVTKAQEEAARIGGTARGRFVITPVISTAGPQTSRVKGH
jgi:hypothetical protein